MTEIAAVLGAGSWGTALAKLLADKGFETRLWSRRASLADAINANRKNPDYLKDAELPACLRATTDLKDAVSGATLIVGVVPTQGTHEVLKVAAPHVSQDAPIVSATKGIEIGTLRLVSDIYAEHFDKSKLAFLGGPSFANEVALNIPTAVSVAGFDPDNCDRVQRAFATDRFRVYSTDDVIGVELGGALKNVIAIAAGIADGLGFGQNTRAGLITRGLAEISRLAIEMGANPLTLAGLSGMGDLVLTCCGDLSRNRTVGLRIGRGEKLPDILTSMNMVAEGVHTAKSAHALAEKRGVEMPITAEVFRMLHEGKSPLESVGSLMMRPPRRERE